MAENHRTIATLYCHSLDLVLHSENHRTIASILDAWPLVVDGDIQAFILRHSPGTDAYYLAVVCPAFFAKATN